MIFHLSAKFPKLNLQNLQVFQVFLLQEALCFVFLISVKNKTFHVSPQKAWIGLCAFPWTARKGIWWCCKATFKKIHCWSYNLFKSGSMSRCGYSKARPWFGNISSETCGHFSACLACAKKSVVLWDVHPLRFESLGPIVLHLPNFESQIITYVNCLISTIAAHLTAFLVKQKP